MSSSRSSPVLYDPISPSFFFFNDTAPPEIYTLSLHDALPISQPGVHSFPCQSMSLPGGVLVIDWRSEEHTSELQSHSDLVCRLLLEKKKLQQAEAHVRLNGEKLRESTNGSRPEEINEAYGATH